MNATFSVGLHGEDDENDEIWIFLSKEQFSPPLFGFPISSAEEIRALAENLIQCANEIDAG